jgi:hypothetical protein
LDQVLPTTLTGLPNELISKIWKEVGAKTVVLTFLTQRSRREGGWVDLEQVLLTDYRVAK